MSGRAGAARPRLRFDGEAEMSTPGIERMGRQAGRLRGRVEQLGWEGRLAHRSRSSLSVSSSSSVRDRGGRFDTR
jgi:hypothetical protein